MLQIVFNSEMRLFWDKYKKDTKELYSNYIYRLLARADGESVDHLLLHCVYAKELWDMIFGWFGISWVMPRADCWQWNSVLRMVWSFPIA
jgi:hypothetical protein